MKKVIFIGGTSYSGSTFFDMILANDTKGFSCGEVYALFYPFREHHINPECGCNDPECNIWSKILKNGKENVYTSIFDIFPEVEFIVDSSKNIFWIVEQIKNLKKNNISYENILIWKSPYEIAESFKKRNQYSNWYKQWIGYHADYLFKINKYNTIHYKDLTTNKEALKTLCDSLNIDYFDNKEEFWTKTHHTLFGNRHAKLHLHNENISDDPNYRNIYYNANKEELKHDVDNIIEKNPEINFIWNILKEKSIINKKTDQIKIKNLKKKLNFNIVIYYLNKIQFKRNSKSFMKSNKLSK
jgi:hypothetical protein